MKPRSKNVALKFSTLVVLTACFSAILASLLVAKNLKNVLTMWGEDVQMTIYLSRTSTFENRDFIQQQLKKSTAVGKINYIAPEKALSDFRIQLASYAPDVGQDAELLSLIPASLQVQLFPTIPAQDRMGVLQDLAQQLKSFEGVEEINYGQEWVEKYGALVSTLEYTIKILSLTILAASLLVMSNVIRASVQNRREEISLLEMIGATYSQIRRPFLKEGAILGATAAGLAVLFCYIAYHTSKNILVSQLSFFQIARCLTFVSSQSALAIVFCGATLGAIASYLCVRSINDGWSSKSSSEVGR